jgi:hypothetical protein
MHQCEKGDIHYVYPTVCHGWYIDLLVPVLQNLHSGSVVHISGTGIQWLNPCSDWEGPPIFFHLLAWVLLSHGRWLLFCHKIYDNDYFGSRHQFQNSHPVLRAKFRYGDYTNDRTGKAVDSSGNVITCNRTGTVQNRK